MRARRDLGHDAAERAVRRFLPREAVCEDGPVAVDERGGGLVAGGFEAEDQRHGGASLHRFGPLEQLSMTQAPFPLRLGTRGSPLALVQARMVAAALCAAHGWTEDAIAIVAVKTTGDRVQDRPLAEIGGKALWTKELDRALLDGEIDFAVHSMKDVETIRPAAIRIAAMLPRADVRDRLIGAATHRRAAATARASAPVLAAPRRAAAPAAAGPRDRAVPRQCRHPAAPSSRRARPTRRCSPPPGSIGSAAPMSAMPIPIDAMLPAPAQGAVGIEARADDDATLALLARDRPCATRTSACSPNARCSRRWARTATRRSAALAVRDGDAIAIRGELLSEEGRHHVVGSIRIAAADPTAAGALAEQLLAQAPPAIAGLFTGR